MGLLDSLSSGSQGGYGGLLDMLMYPSQQPQAVPLPQYDTMGTPFAPGVPTAPDPFGPPPQMDQWAKQFAPASPFTNTAPTPPVQFAAGPTMQPQQQPASPPSQAPTDSGQVNDAMVGGYSMPRLGSVADYTPDPAALPQNAQPAQGQLPSMQPPQQTTPSFLGGQQGAGIGDRLMAGVQNFANAGGPLQALAGGISGLASGNRTDAAGVAQQNLKAQYDSLVPMLGPQKAMLAVMNPEAGKILLAQALEKKQYGFQKLDSDTVLRTDPLTGKAEVAYGGERSNTIQGPDGKMITMPEGADPKTWRNEITRINADVAAGKKTEVQAKAEIFANKMELSNKSINLEGTSLAGKIASGLPLGNYAQTKEYQQYKQASSNFITALLRQESGAAISKSEFERYDKEYMPQPGDGPDVLAQKTEARRVAIDGMKKGAGPGYKSPTDSPTASLPSGWSVRVR